MSIPHSLSRLVEIPALRRVGLFGLAVGAALAVAWSAAHLLMPGVGRQPADLGATSYAYALAYYGHSIPGTIAMVAGATQFTLLSQRRSGRQTRRGVHVWLGRAYVASALLLGVLGFVIADRATGGFASHFGFRLLAILIVVTTSVGWLRIRQHDWRSHVEWMTRSYALVFAFATFRFWLLVFPDGLINPESYTAAGWWTLLSNLTVAEMINGRRRTRQARVVHGARGGSSSKGGAVQRRPGLPPPQDPRRVDGPIREDDVRASAPQ